MRTIPLLASLAFALAVLPAAARHDGHADHTAASGALAPLKAPEGARVFIISPANGETVGREVTVRFGAENVEIRPAGDLTPGSGHHHLLIDARELPPMDAPIPDDAHHRHFGKGQTETTLQLEPGTHTLQLDLGDARHMQFDPPVVSEVVTIQVE